MKPRPFGSFARAISKVRESLGEGECAKVVRRSPALVKKWCDPDHLSLPSLAQSVALDVAFVRAGLGEPPILLAFGEQVSQSTETYPNEDLDLVRFTIVLQLSFTDLSRTIMQVADARSGAGRAMPEAEKRAALTHIEDLDAQLRRLRRWIEREPQ